MATRPLSVFNQNNRDPADRLQVRYPGTLGRHRDRVSCMFRPMSVGHWTLLLCMLVSQTAAHADNPSASTVSVRLVYQRAAGAESCPDEASLRAAVVQRVGFDPFDEAATRVISCRVERVGKVLRARVDAGVSADQQSSARELVSKQTDCRELADAIQLALSIAINPLIVAVHEESATPAETRPAENQPSEEIPSVKPLEPAPLPAPTVLPAATLAAPPPARPQSAFALRLGADAALAVGLNPGLAYAATMHAGLRRAWLSANLEGRVITPTARDVGRGSVRVWQWAVLFAPCAHRGGVSGCLLSSVGMTYGHGEGFAINEKSSSPSAFAGARAAWEYPNLGRKLRLRASLDLMAALTQVHFTLGGANAWTSPSLAALFGVGVLGDFFQ